MWWAYLVTAAVLMLGVYGFVRVTRWNTRLMTKHDDRTSLDEIYRRNRDRMPRKRRTE